MAKAVISSILESQLGKYVDGLSSDSLQIGLWSGELVLQNLSLKPHALAELELPVTVVRGSIRRIHVVVPWNQLGSASVQVAIDGVYALVAPNTQLPTRDELAQAKANSIERQELVRQHNRFAAAHNDASGAAGTGVDESTFLSRLTERIIDNLHVTLRDIHLRYEDAVSNPDVPFACGVVIKRFAFHTTDAEGHDVFLDRTARRERFVHKRVALEGLGVYWDRLPRDERARWVQHAPDIERAMERSGASNEPHAWMLRPCALAVQLTKNESLDYGVAAKFTVQAKLYDITLALAREQYEDLLFVHTAFVGRRAIESHFLQARCRPFHDARTSPHEWWDYAVRLALAARRQAAARADVAASTSKSANTNAKRSRLRWSTVQRAAAERRLYIDAFRVQLRKSGSGGGAVLDAVTKHGAAIRAYERAYPVDVIMAARDVAEDEEAAEKRRRAESAASQSKTAASSSATVSTGSWYGYFFGGGASTAASAATASNKLTDVFTAEGRADLKQAYDEVASKQQAQSVPPGCNLVSVKLQLQNGSLSLFESDGGDGGHTAPLLTAKADGSLSVNMQPADEWDARFRLERFEVLNGKAAAGTAFHTFCSLSSAAKAANPKLPCVSIDAKLRHDSAVTAAAESSASGQSSLLHVRVSAMPIRVLLDPALVLAVQRFFDSLLPEQQLERVWSFATSSVSDWIFADQQDEALATTLQRGRTELRYDVAVDMSAPVFVVPESVDDPRTSVVVVDLGEVSFRSDASEHLRDAANALVAASTPAPAHEPATLRWRLEVTNVQLLLGRLDDLDWSDAVDIGRFAKLVQQLNLAFDVETFAPTLALRPSKDRAPVSLVPNVSVRAAIPQIAVSLAEPQLVALARIHSSILTQATLADSARRRELHTTTVTATNATDAHAHAPGTDTTAGVASTMSTTTSTATTSTTYAAADKYHLQVQVVVGEIVVTLREASARDALRLCVTQMSFDLGVFASQYVAQARLQSLLMEDLLYDESSCFRALMSTGAVSETHLVTIDVTMYPPTAAPLIADQLDDRTVVAREASFLVVDVHFNVLHVQWNPSSMSLIYRIASAYVLALQHRSVDADGDMFDASTAADGTSSISSNGLGRIDDTAGASSTTQDIADATHSTAVPPVPPSTLESSTLESSKRPDLPSILARASLVQFSVTFNKDDMNRQLVQLAIKDASLECTSQDVVVVSGSGTSSETRQLAPAFELTGYLGNLIATDLSMVKNTVYTPLVGLDESQSQSSSPPPSSAKSRRAALLTFSYALDPRVSARSVLSLQFQPVRMVYYHQQVLELVDYLFEGILGTMVSQTLLSATQLLLSETEASVVLQVAFEQPTVVLPVCMTDADHVAITAEMVRLVHAPTSAVHFFGTGTAAERRKAVAPGEALAASVVHRSDCISLRIDHKQVTLKGMNVFCVTASSSSSSSSSSTAMASQSVVASPIDLVVDVEDFVASDIRLGDASSAYLPRFAIKVTMTTLELRLRHCDYVLLVALVLDNFGAEQLQVASPSAASTRDERELAGRPNVSYTYSRTDLDAATMELGFVMKTLRCVLYESGHDNIDDSDAASADCVVQAALSGRERPGERATSEIVASDVAMSLQFLCDVSPRIAVRVASFVVRELAHASSGAALAATDASSGGSAGAGTCTLTSESRGVVLVCTQPTQVAYVWDDTKLTCELELNLSSATGVLVPETLLDLVDFFTVPTKSPPAQTTAASASATMRTPLETDSDNTGGAQRKRRQSITELVKDAAQAGPEYAMTVRLSATQMALDVPQLLGVAACPRISLGADLSVEYTWKPTGTRGEAGSGGDFDIQSSVVLDARAIEVVVKNANRQGCRVSYDAHGGHVDMATMVQILEPCDLHIEVSDLFPHAGQQQQIVAFRFTPIEMFVSYDDACIGLDTLRAMSASLTQYELTRRHARTGDDGAAAVLASAAASDRAKSAGVLSPKSFANPSVGGSSAAGSGVAGGSDLEIHRYFTCEVGSMRLTVINDCDGCDMGLVQMHMQRCNVFMNVTYAPTPLAGAVFPPPATVISGGGGFVTMLSYYNPDTRTWHQMCRDWGLDVSLQGSIYNDPNATTGAAGSQSTAPPLHLQQQRASDNELHIIVTANQPLDLLVTHGLLEVIASAGGAWNRRAYGSAGTGGGRGSTPVSPIAGSHTSGSSSPRSSSAREASERKKHAPCVVRNETGLSVRFWLTNGQSSTQQQTLVSGEIADLHYVHSVGRGAGVVRTYASSDRADATMRLCIELLDSAFQPVQGIIFEQLGSRAFPLVNAAGSTSQFTLNCYAQLVDGRILLALSSQIKLVNNLSMPVQLLVNDPTWHSPVDIGVLDPGRESAIPVLLSLGTELRVRPIDDAFSWSAPIPVQTRSALEQKVEAASNGAADVHSAIFCIAMTVEQSLRIVCLSEPIVMFNKLPVEVEYRVKSPLLNRSNASTHQRNALRVGAAGGIWWTDSSQRPQFTLCVEGCKPSKWLELVHPGTKSGEVVAIGLERLDGRPFRLLLQVVEETAKSLHVFLYAEVWFINRTGLELVYGNEADAEAYVPPLEARALVGNAQICAFSSASDSNSSGAPVVRLRMASCSWSSRFVADPRRLSWQDECLSLRSERRATGSSDASTMLYEFGVSADYSTRHFGSITTLVSVIPRYLVLNRSAHTVLLFEDAALGSAKGHGNTAHHILARGDVYALYWVTGARCKLHASVLAEHSDFGWSKTFSVDHVATSDIVIPAVAHSTGAPSANLTLQLTVKRGSISQATFVVVITDAGDANLNSPAVSPSHSASAAVAAAAHGGWDTFSLHTQIAGIIVTVADKKQSDDSVSGSGPRSAERQRAMQRGSAAHDLFGTAAADDANENVARLTISRISVESNVSREGTSAKMNVMGVKVEDLLTDSKHPVVLRPVFRSSPYDPYRSAEKYFVELTYVERPHAKYTYVEKLRVELQDVKITTSMRFVDRLNALVKETIAHFQNRSLTAAASSHVAATTLLDAARDENILEYFVTSAAVDDDSDASMASLTGQKLYVESCEIAPVRVVVSFSRGKQGSNAKTQGFWLANLKLKIENACLTLDAYKLSHALATQEALLESLTSFYVKSVKSQALGLIDSIQVTSLVTSMVTGGVSTLVSTILGKTDPSLAASMSSSASHFTYQFQTNAQIMDKHSRLLAQCRSSTQFLDQVRHLIFDWDSNHTGLEARGCVALGILNNSRHSLVLNTRLNDGAEIRVLPLGRRALAGVADTSGSSDSSNEWRADRAVVVFAWGYTPTLLTSGDVYFTVQSNACNVFVTRKTARLKANLGYTATFTHQESQSWWSTNVVIVGDDIQAHTSSHAAAAPSRLSVDASSAGRDRFSSSSSASDAGFDLFGSSTMSTVSTTLSSVSPDEYEVVFKSAALGIIAKQSRRAVIVRELCTLPSGAAGPALACGQIAPGDTILAVSGMTVTNTTQFAQLVSQSPRPVVLRFRRTSEQVSAAHDLFGEAPPMATTRTASSRSSRQTSAASDGDDGFDLFGARQ